MNSGKLLFALGLLLMLLGAVKLLGGKLPPLGRLPGDISIRQGGVTIYVPLTTCLILSLLISLLLKVAK